MRNWLLFIFILCFALAGYPVSWDPIPESQLSITEPRLDPNANAETIFWKTWLTDRVLGGRQPQSIKEQYLRIKIFNARGVEEHSTIDLVSSKRDLRIRDLQARTIKPDGRIIELENKNIFERTLVRAGRDKIKMMSFSMPGVEPGDIIEYQWKEYQDNFWNRFNRLYLQMEIPMWSVTYYVNPSEYANDYLHYSMNYQAFNAPQEKFEQTPDKFAMVTYQDMPAFKPENNMPPEDQVRSWILLFYSPGGELDPEKYWVKIGKELYEYNSEQMRVDGKIKDKAKELTAGLKTVEEKVDKIYDFCINDIKNYFHDRYGVTRETLQKAEVNKKPSDTLKQGMGDGEDINMLFAALLNAVDIEARWTYCAGRDKSFFNRQFLDTLFLDREYVSVLINGKWRFYNLSAPYLENGMLDWQAEGVQALITDKKEPVFVLTPMSGPERNRTNRKAALKLLADGTIEGSIEETYRGHPGIALKRAYDGKTEQERQNDFIESIQSRMSNAEVSDVQFENVMDLEKPFTVRYQIKVPGYAERTNKRMFLQPGFFYRNSQPMFPTSVRKYQIYFDYPWTDHDEVTIELPEGFDLEGTQTPASLPINQVGEYKMNLSVNADGKLVYVRDFRFGDNNNVLFPVKAYPQIKRIFDYINKQDTQPVTLSNTAMNE